MWGKRRCSEILTEAILMCFRTVREKDSFVASVLVREGEFKDVDKHTRLPHAVLRMIRVLAFVAWKRIDSEAKYISRYAKIFRGL